MLLEEYLSLHDTDDIDSGRVFVTPETVGHGCGTGPNFGLEGIGGHDLRPDWDLTSKHTLV